MPRLAQGTIPLEEAWEQMETKPIGAQHVTRPFVRKPNAPARATWRDFVCGLLWAFAVARALGWVGRSAGCLHIGTAEGTAKTACLAALILC